MTLLLFSKRRSGFASIRDELFPMATMTKSGETGMSWIPWWANWRCNACSILQPTDPVKVILRTTASPFRSMSVWDRLGHLIRGASFKPCPGVSQRGNSQNKGKSLVANHTILHYLLFLYPRWALTTHETQ